MKANACGTMTEQLRARVGWHRSEKYHDRCDKCEHVAILRTTLRCQKHGFATRATAICNDWSRK